MKQCGLCGIYMSYPEHDAIESSDCPGRCVWCVAHYGAGRYEPKRAKNVEFETFRAEKHLIPILEMMVNGTTKEEIVNTLNLYNEGLNDAFLKHVRKNYPKLLYSSGQFGLKLNSYGKEILQRLKEEKHGIK